MLKKNIKIYENFGFPAEWLCFNCSNKIIKNSPRSLFFFKLNSYQATYFLSLQKLFCFGGFIVTTFIMLILVLLFLIFLHFHTFFFKISYYSYFFTLKCNKRNKNTEKFSSLASLAPFLKHNYIL